MSTPEDAAGITGISARRIYAGIETGAIHFSESPNALLVCIDSLDTVRQANKDIKEVEKENE
ncbi:MAG TPA: hypothetical protein VNA17_11375 [Pyrinomonadaceae bacterium]|nr:hypothetical protein [Pyrinomonadaceae bacterium]